jgi:hypothetical protein
MLGMLGTSECAHLRVCSGGIEAAGGSLMRRVLAVFVTVAFLVVFVVGSAFAHPVETPRGTLSVAGDSQGHTHGLECAADRSPVIGNLGLPCAADR